MRVRPLPEEGARLAQEFEAALRQGIGGERAGILLQVGKGWLDSKFSRHGSEPRTISAVRHPNGTYNISIRSAGGSMSVGGIMQLDEYVPAYLLPMFASLQ